MSLYDALDLFGDLSLMFLQFALPVWLQRTLLRRMPKWRRECAWPEDEQIARAFLSALPFLTMIPFCFVTRKKGEGALAIAYGVVLSALILATTTFYAIAYSLLLELAEPRGLLIRGV